MPDTSKPSGAENDINILSSIEALVGDVMQTLENAIGGMAGSLNTLQGNIDRINSGFGGAGDVGGGAQGGGPSPTDMTSLFDRLTRAVTNLSQTVSANTDATIQASQPVQPQGPVGHSLYTPGQIAEMARHREMYANGRVVTDIPTFATYGSTLQPSALSTLDRSRNLLGLNLGVSDRAKPNEYPSHATGIDIGNEMRTFFRGSDSLIRTMQGSLGKSYEYAQNQGQIGDDYRNTAFARSGLQEFYKEQERKGTPLTQKEKGYIEVGLNERSMRESAQLTNMAGGSLNRLITAHQSGAIQYTPFIAMDSTGPSGAGSAGATVSTRSIMKTDVIGRYAQGLMKTMQDIDHITTSSDVKTSAVNDIQAKVTATRDHLVSALAPKDALEKLWNVGVVTPIGHAEAQDMLESQRRSSNARDLQMRAEKKRLELREKLNESALRGEASTTSPDHATYQHISKKLETVNKVLAKAEKNVSEYEPRYQEKRDAFVSGFSGESIRKMLVSGDPELAAKGKILLDSAKLEHGKNVLAGTEDRTRAEKVDDYLTEKSAGASEFAASMMKNLQWSLMFAFSGTVFQALSQIPTQATYETVAPVYSGIANLTGIGPLQSEIMGFGSQAPAIMGELQSRTNSLQALLGSEAYSSRAVSTALDISKAQPIQFGEAMEVMSAMATYPSTKAQAANPAFQKTMFENVQMLSMLAPEQGTGGALFAIREMLSGQFRSLQMRFNISPELLASYSGMSAGQMKSQSGVDMMGTMNRGLMGMFGGPDILMRRGAESQIQLKNITDTLTASIIKPMVTDRDVSVSTMLSKMLDVSSSDMGKLGELLPEAQKEMIKNSSLQAVATTSGIKFEKGDTIESLARKRTEKLGGDYEENKRYVKTGYEEGLRSNVQSVYGTAAGAQSLILSGLNTGLSQVLSAFSPAAGLSSIFTSFLGQYSDRLSTYQEKSASASDVEGRQQLANEFITGLMDDIQQAIKSASAGLNTGEFGRIIGQVTETVRVGAEAVFAPIGEAIMTQTAKTAIGLPGLMVGGALSSAVSGIAGGAWNVVSGAGTAFRQSVFGRDDKEMPVDFTGGMLGSAATLSNLMAWGAGITGLKTSPLAATTKFAGWSLGAKGITDIQQGDALGGMGAISGAIAMTILPNVIPAALDKWKNASILDTVGGTGAAGGAGPAGSRVRRNAFDTVLDTGSALVNSFGILDALKARGEYKRREEALAVNRVSWGTATKEMLFGNAAGSTGLSGVEGSKGLLGSKGSRILMGGVGVAVSAASIGGMLRDDGSVEKSGLEKFGEIAQLAGGVAASLGGFVPVIGPAISAIGLLGTAAGAAASYIGSKSRENTAQEKEKIREQTGLMYDQSIGDPLRQAKKLGASSFDQAVERYGLRNSFSESRLGEMRETNIELTSFSETLNEQLARSVNKKFKESVIDDAKKGDEKKRKLLDSPEDLNREMTANASRVLPIQLAALKTAFETPMEAFKDDGKGGTTNELRKDFLDDIESKLRSATGDEKLSKSYADTIKTAILENNGRYNDLQGIRTADLKDIGPNVAQKAVDEYWFQSTKPMEITEDTYKDYNSLTTLPEKVQQNIGIGNALQKESGDLINQIMSGGGALWGMSFQQAKGLEKTQGKFEAQWLGEGHMNVKELFGANGNILRHRITQAVGSEKAQELAQAAIMKQVLGYQKNQATLTEQMDQGLLPSAYSPTVLKELDAFEGVVNKLGGASSSTTGSVDALAEALTGLKKTIDAINKPAEGTAAAGGTPAKETAPPASFKDAVDKEKKEETARDKFIADTEKLVRGSDEEVAAKKKVKDKWDIDVSKLDRAAVAPFTGQAKANVQDVLGAGTRTLSNREDAYKMAQQQGEKATISRGTNIGKAVWDTVGKPVWDIFTDTSNNPVTGRGAKNTELPKEDKKGEGPVAFQERQQRAPRKQTSGLERAMASISDFFVAPLAAEEADFQKVSTASLGLEGRDSKLRQMQGVNFANFEHMNITDKLKSAGVNLDDLTMNKKQIPVPSIESDELDKNLSAHWAPFNTNVRNEVSREKNRMSASYQDMLPPKHGGIGGEIFKPENFIFVGNRNREEGGYAPAYIRKSQAKYAEEAKAISEKEAIARGEKPAIDTPAQPTFKGLTQSPLSDRDLFNARERVNGREPQGGESHGGTRQDLISRYAEIMRPGPVVSVGNAPMESIMRLANANKGTRFETGGGLQISVPTPEQSRRNEIMANMTSRYAATHPGANVYRDDSSMRPKSAPAREDDRKGVLHVDRIHVVTPTTTVHSN